MRAATLLLPKKSLHAPRKDPQEKVQAGFEKASYKLPHFCISNILLNKDVQKEISQDGCGKCSALSELPPLLL